MREIEFKPSGLLKLLQLTMLVLALIAIFFAAIPVAIATGLALAAVGSTAWAWRAPQRLCSLRIKADGTLQARDPDGDWVTLEVLGDSLVLPALIVLRTRIAGNPPRTLVLLPDSAQAEDLRCLRVSLRWGRHTRSDTASPDAG